MEDAPVEEAPVEEQVEESPAEPVEEPEEGQEPDGTAAAKAEKPEGPTREQFDAATFKLTVNGKEVEVTGKDLAAAYQRGESGAAKLREAADLRKQVESKEQQLRQVAKELSTPEGFYEMLLAMKTDPLEFLGKFANLAKEEAKLTPEQRELRALKSEKALTEKQRAEQERLAAEEAERAQIESVQDAYEDAFEDEMDKLGIPEDDDIRDELLVHVGRLAAERFDEDPYVDEIVKEVWDKYQARYQKLAPKVAPAEPPAQKPKIPGTRPAPKTPSAPRVAKNERLVYPSGASIDDIRKMFG